MGTLTGACEYNAFVQAGQKRCPECARIHQQQYNRSYQRKNSKSPWRMFVNYKKKT